MKLNLYKALTLFVLLSYGVVTRAQGPLPTGWSDSDVGSVSSSGSASYTNGSITLNGAGSAIYGSSDSFHFAYQPLSGDGSIVARVVSVSNGSGYATAGVMIRETLDPSSSNAKTADWPSYNGIYFDARTSTGGGTSEPCSSSGSVMPPYWVKVSRSGDNFNSSWSADGVTWTVCSTTETISMATNVYIGLEVNSGSSSNVATAVFDNVSITSSALTPPVISSVSTATPNVGTQVVISGSGFGGTQGSSIVALNATVPNVSAWSDTSITIDISATAPSGPLAVLVAPSMNASNPINLTIPHPLPSGWMEQDIGTVGVAGSSSYVNNVFTIQGAGGGFTGAADGIHFVYQSLSSTDATIVARITNLPTSSSEAGIMIRQSLDPGSPNASEVLRSQDYFFVFDRTTPNASASLANYLADPSLPYWMKLVCASGSITAYISRDGVSWTPNGSVISIGLGSSIDVGLAVTSQNTSQSAAAKFDNVSVSYPSVPAPVISSVSATSGQIGSSITLTGTGFGSTQGASGVFLNGVSTTINSWSGMSISVTVPAGATSGDLIVSVAPSFNDSNPVEFNVSANPLPSGWLDQDVGSVSVGGSASYTGGVFTVQGAGYTIASYPGTSDTFHFVYQPLSGDGTIVARIISDPGSSGQAGVMIRDSLDASAANAFTAFVVANGIPFFFDRPAATEAENNTQSSTALSVPCWVKVVRSGVNLYGYQSADGVNWVQIGWPQAVNLGSDIYVGLAVDSGNVNTLSTATFDNVSVTSASAPSPMISSVSATTGAVGSQVTINGSSFGSTQGNSAVVLNDVPVTINTWSDTSISITIPAGATSGYLTVATAPLMNNSNPVTFTVTSQFLPGGWLDRDIGVVGLVGNASYSGGVFTVQAGGSGISGTSDAFHYVYQPLATDGTIVVRVASASGTWGSQAGVVVRETLDAQSPETAVLSYDYSGSFNIYANFRALSGAGTSQGSLPGNPSVTPPYWMKVTRTANTFTAAASVDGSSWMQLGNPQTITTAQQVYVGFGVASTATTVFSSATFDNVAITVGTTLPNPTVTGISPTTGAPGTSVTINGSGFGMTQGVPGTLCNNDVCFNGAASSTITSWSDTQIVAIVPDDATSGPVSVTVGGVTSTGPQFTLKFAAQVTDSLGNVSNYSAAPSGGLWMMTDLQGSGCSSCSARGNLHNQFDSNGHRIWSVDALGTTTSYRYDSSGNVIEQLTPLNSSTNAITQYVYNGFGEVTSTTDALNHTTTNAYDSHGNLTSVTTPTGSVTQFAYNALGQLTQITDPLSNVTTLTYTTAGLIATIKDAQNNVTTYGYDAHGNRTSVTDAMSNQTAFAYDAGDRLTTITYPDSTTTTFGYDYRGRRTSVTDQNGKTTTYAYDDADRLTSVTDAANHVTTYGYDTENNLTSITDANGHETAFSYDAFSRVTQTNFPSSLIETYAYDANNNLTSKTDRKGQTIGYVYDALNRLIQKNYPDSSGVEYVYDLVGKIQSVNDPTGTYAFAYDNDGRLIGTTTSYSFLTSRDFTTSYTYDNGSNRTVFTDPENGSTAYSYDTLNRLTTLMPASAFTTGSFGFSYDALSRRTQMTRPNNVTTSYAYDGLSRLTGVLQQLSGSTMDGATYTLDNAGKRTARTDQRTATATSYGYDNIYQLLSATQGGSTTETYTYDPVGNRTSSLGVASYTTNSSNEMTANSNGSYTYDANGNTISKSDSTGTTNYTWDYDNRLTSVTLPGSGGTVSYRYDPFGRRAEKISPTATSIYAYDWDSLIEETNAVGTAIARYSGYLNIDEPLAMLRSGVTSYYEADGLGSVTSLTNAAGSVAQTYAYDSFGNLTTSNGSLVNSFQYTGREFDSETALYFMRARYLDPKTGRFISEDPLRFEGKEPSFYNYVGNSPANYVDPSGLSPWDKARSFINCVDGCLKTMLRPDFCTLKKNLIRVAVGGPIVAVGICGLIVVSEPYLAPAFVPCVAVTTVSNWGIGGSIVIGRWNLQNLGSGVGCTTFCALNELR